MKESVKTINCPQCGYPLPLRFKYSKLIKCPACKSDIFLEDEAVRLAGKSSVISDIPSLLELGIPFSCKNTLYTPIGRIRYTTERYAWDEWWILENNSEGIWLSVDDGEYILEKETEFNIPVNDPARVKLGDTIEGWSVTEKGRGLCEGFEGELPELIEIGETHDYIHLEKDDGRMMTAEFFGNDKKLYIGKWLDPYDIRKVLNK